MKHILGLDLGTNSIGWAVINAIKEENTQKEQLIGINTAGSRIIPMDAAQLGDFNRKIASHPTIIRISSKALCQPIRQVWKVYSQFRAQARLDNKYA